MCNARFFGEIFLRFDHSNKTDWNMKMTVHLHCNRFCKAIDGDSSLYKRKDLCVFWPCTDSVSLLARKVVIAFSHPSHALISLSEAFLLHWKLSTPRAINASHQSEMLLFLDFSNWNINGIIYILVKKFQYYRCHYICWIAQPVSNSLHGKVDSTKTK